MTRSAFRALWLAAPAALSLLASCSSQPAATDTEKTAVVVPKEANAAADSTAAATDSTAR
jgi:hypothetical protein